MSRRDYPSGCADQFVVRLPDGLRDQIKADAKANGRSMNAQIIARLEGGAETLRDKAALAAMTGILASTAHPNSGGPASLGAKAIANSAFEAADAFMAARSGASS